MYGLGFRVHDCKLIPFLTGRRLVSQRSRFDWGVFFQLLGLECSVQWNLENGCFVSNFSVLYCDFVRSLKAKSKSGSMNATRLSTVLTLASCWKGNSWKLGNKDTMVVATNSRKCNGKQVLYWRWPVRHHWPVDLQNNDISAFGLRSLPLPGELN